MEKKLLIGIVAVLVLLGAVFGIDQWNQARKEARLIKQVDRQLSDSSRKIYEDRIADADKKLLEVATDEEKIDWLRYKAIQLQGLGRLEEAKNVLLQAANIDSKNFNVLINLHLVYLEMQNFDAAKDTIKKAISLKPSYGPDYADAWRRYIFLEKDKFDSSVEHIKSLFEQALAETKGHIDIVTVYAGYLEEIGDLQGAKEYWQKAIEINSRDKAIYEAEIKRIDDKLKAL